MARRFALAVGLLTLSTCAPPVGELQLPPSPAATVPEVRIGVLVGSPALDIGGDSGVLVQDADGNTVAAIEAGSHWRTRAVLGAVDAGPTGAWQLTGQRQVTFVPRVAGSWLRVGTQPYRGRLTIAPDRTGLTVVNAVSLEDYLAGVVAAEMGRRDSTDGAALEAQAIVSRTFALRNLGKRATEGFDLYATVADMVYSGAVAEYPAASAAVAATAGQILTWQGVPIDAFFFSTCAGQTAAGTEVFVAADRPYLQSVRDVDPDGQAYCRISPRFRWREEWSIEQLRGVLKSTLPPATATTAEAAASVRGVTVVRRTASDRVSRVTIALRTGGVDVDGPAIRRVLRPAGDAVLRSAIFQLSEVREGSQLRRLVADGAGAGHGVGFCQWGAVGRARAGQDAPTILAAYFPGTTLGRAY
ncbi:MAG: SpoIID/LytB domain-containing protein [Gemmatimonadales bacterium]